jgi:hypothetical protein
MVYSPSEVASAECVPLVGICDLCGVPRHACMMRLRRVGLHARFHAQGTTSRLARPAFALYVAKDLKAIRALSAYLSPHHPQSFVILYFQVRQSRVTFLSSLPLILQITLNVSVFLIHRQSESLFYKPYFLNHRIFHSHHFIIMRFTSILPVLLAAGVAQAQFGGNKGGNNGQNNGQNNGGNNGGNALALNPQVVQKASNADGLGGGAEAGQAASKT